MIRALRERVLGGLKQRLSGPSRRRLKMVYRRARAPLRVARRRLGQSVDIRRLAADLAAGEIDSGDMIMVHSSLSRIGNVEGGANTVIRSLMEAVGPEGTILMSAYGDADTVFDSFRKGVLTDLRTAPALTGAISELFRTQPGVRRSSHPFSSVCAWGKYAEYVVEGHARDPRVVHADSPIGRLLELGGKVVGLGVSLGPVSFYHVLEDTWEGFPFEVYSSRPEQLTYVTADGERVTREVRCYDPVRRRTRIDQPEGTWIRTQFTAHFRRRGLLKEFRYGEADSWLIEVRQFYDELKRLASEGVTMYLTEEKAAALGKSVESW